MILHPSSKKKPNQSLLKNKSVAMLFFNPSLRTKTSFEIGISELQGTAVILQPGKDAWPIEFKDHIEMNGDEEEHVKEVAQVLSSYCDCIAIRAFPAFEDWNFDRTARGCISILVGPSTGNCDQYY